MGLIHAISSDIRPFSEQSLLSDLVIEGTVTGIETRDDHGDGFDVSVSVSVNDILKGGIPADTIMIRQRNISRLSDSATRPAEGEAYIFYCRAEYMNIKKQTTNFLYSMKPKFAPLALVTKIHLLFTGCIG